MEAAISRTRRVAAAAAASPVTAKQRTHNTLEVLDEDRGSRPDEAT
jgi:hypothetical protein